VLSLKDIMTRKKHSHGVELQFTRIPITAERAPDPVDMSEMLEHVMRLDEGTPIVLNCQLGRGRSTMASIIISLAQGWLAQSRAPATPGAGSGPGKRPTLNRTLTLDLTSQPQQRSYQAINSASSGLGVSMQDYSWMRTDLLRVIRHGLGVKSAVDNAIDACSAMYNM